MLLILAHAMTMITVGEVYAASIPFEEKAAYLYLGGMGTMLLLIVPNFLLTRGRLWSVKWLLLLCGGYFLLLAPAAVVAKEDVLFVPLLGLAATATAWKVIRSQVYMEMALFFHTIWERYRRGEKVQLPPGM